MTDREILRTLAREYMEIASLDVQKENARLYRALNGLKPIRPVVLIDEIPWNQLAVMDELKLRCEGERERRVESFFRMQLYRWRHFPCDMILPPYFPMNRHIEQGSFGIDISEDILAYDIGNSIVSHAYKDQIPDEAAIERLHCPAFTVDEDADRRELAWLNDLMGDLIEIRPIGLQYASFFEPWDNIAMWRGVEPMLWDLVDRPEFLHALMEKLLSVRLEMLDKLERMNLLDNSSPYLHCTAGLCDDLPEPADGHVARRSLWGRGAAQIFASVSPAMTEEFELAYARRFFEGFGLMYYGCCEPLHQKIDIIRSLPNLRKISITPWADVDASADQMGRDYVMANKPNPALLAVSQLDEAAVRAEIQAALNACSRSGTPVEFTLKDISSIGNNPENLDRWATIVMEMVR